MPRPTRNSQATADDSLTGGEMAVSSINARDVRSSSLLSSSATQPTASAVASAQNSPGLVQSLVAAVQESVQTALAPLVEAAVQQHSRASGNPFTSGLGEAANRFEMSGEPSFLSAPSPSSSRPLEMAARSSNQSISDPQRMLRMTSFVSAPGFLGTFNQLRHYAGCSVFARDSVFVERTLFLLSQLYQPIRARSTPSSNSPS